ncbi:MAG TPA: hypothetical protein VMK82_01435 [Steroidobacteraceae bacterium]|nr:hypothetical protein [Steroidobacteraceae bacterium]
MQRIRPHRRFLHAALLLLVAFGVLLQPILGALGGLHELEHAVAAQSDHGHSHLEGHDEPAGGEDPYGDPVGAHDLLHHGGFAASMALLDPASMIFLTILVGDHPGRDHASGPPALRLTLPFRPPIV